MRIMKQYLTVLSIILIIGVLFAADTGAVKLSWDANTETDLAGYNVFIWDEAKVTISPDSSDGKYQYFDISKLKNVPNVISLTLTKNSLLYNWSNLTPFGATFRVGVSAFDLTSNESMAVTMSIVLLKPPDVTSPAIPNGLELLINILINIKG